MESPERSSMVPAVSEDQGSPIFNFLCSLSPIKVVKSVHIAQTLAEFNFPPPPTVFVTPRVDSKRDTRTLQKNGSSDTSDLLQNQSKNSHDCVQNEIRQPLVNTARRIQGVRKVEGQQVKNNVCNSPCNSPSKLVDQYLAEPMEVELKSLKEELDVHKEIVDGTQDGKMRSGKCNGNDDLKDAQLIESLRSTHLDSQEIRDDKFVLELDQETSGLVFFMSEDAEKQPITLANLNGWQNQASSSLSDTPIQRLPSPFTSHGEIGSKNAMHREVDCLSTQIETNALASKAANVDSLDQPGGGANKVNLPSQRGFRRRCLDFEEGQGKIKSTSPALKQNASNGDIQSENDASSIPDSTTQLYVLKERVLATSGATNSDAAKFLDTDKGAQLKANCVHNSAQSLKDSHVDMGYHHSCDIQHSPGNIAVSENMQCGTLCFNSSMPSSESSLRSTNASLGTTPPSRSSDDGYRNYLPSGNPCYLLDIGLEGCDSFVSLMEERKESECDLQLESSELPVIAIENIQLAEIGLKHSQESVPTYGFEKKPTLLGHRRGSQRELSCQVESDDRESSDQSPPSPKKKRRSTSSTDKSGGVCKRCNCKKSKCLKLYCECFAAGVYCVDSCSCQGCQNKPEFEEVVLETRQQIESRNPLAFAPKVVLAAPGDLTPSTMEKNSGDTPPARHKRGCNCKKSKCLKKYCECYQAGVGCSDGCRCEDCQNIHGRKEGFKDSDEKDISSETAEKEALYDQVEVSEYCHELTDISQQQHHNLSPITPSLEHMGPNRSALMSRSASKRRFSYEELQSPPFLLSSSKPPKTPSRLLRSSKEIDNTFLPTSGRRLSSSPISTPDLFAIDQFSPRWDGLADICTLTPLPQAPNRAVPASVSKLDEPDDSSPSINFQQCDSLLSSDNKRFASKNSRLAHCISPMYPSKVSDDIQNSQTSTELQNVPLMSTFNAHVSGTDPKGFYNDSKALQQKSTEDVMPECLKDPETSLSPVCQLKTSSPKRKRVSPPSSRETLHGSFHSPASRSVRKFILRSIPSTPSIDGS